MLLLLSMLQQNLLSEKTREIDFYRVNALLILSATTFSIESLVKVLSSKYALTSC